MSRNQTPDKMAEELARLLDDAPQGTHDDELSELVHLAEGLREVPTATPDPQFRSRLRDQLLMESAQMLPATDVATATQETPSFLTGVRERVTRWRRSANLAIASALSATSIAGAGVAVASQSALPGDALYGVKQGIESVRMALAGGDLEQGRLHLAFARERLSEVTEGVGELTPDQLIDTLQAWDDAAAVGANELIDVYERTGDIAVLRELASFIEDQRAQLLELTGELPVEAIPFAQASLDLLRDIQVQATTAAGFGGLPAADPGTTDGGDTGVGEPATGDDGPGTSESPSEPTTADEPTAGDTGSGEGVIDDPLEPIESPLGEIETPTLEPTLPSIEPTLPSIEPSLPSLEPSLPTDAVEDTVGDLLSE